MATYDFIGDEDGYESYSVPLIYMQAELYRGVSYSSVN
jgi:hypothetical protein